MSEKQFRPATCEAFIAQYPKSMQPLLERFERMAKQDLRGMQTEYPRTVILPAKGKIARINLEAVYFARSFATVDLPQPYGAGVLIAQFTECNQVNDVASYSVFPVSVRDGSRALRHVTGVDDTTLELALVALGDKLSTLPDADCYRPEVNLMIFELNGYLEKHRAQLQAKANLERLVATYPRQDLGR